MSIIAGREMMRDHMEPKWLVWAREIQATAQTGLAYTKDAFDRQRYEHLRHLAARMMAERSGVDAAFVAGLFAEQTGYATPKVDVRGAVFGEGKILLVRERADSGRWTLPGGWADVNRSPRECVVSEVREEAGLEVKPVKLAAVYDRARHPHVPPYPFHIYKMFFICEIVGGVPSPGIETEEVDFFGADELPELSLSRVLDYQITRMFAHIDEPNMPTEFD
jgi:ADP-ribose pyrophosphatase YjhB (NUDIX family)